MPSLEPLEGKRYLTTEQVEVHRKEGVQGQSRCLPWEGGRGSSQCRRQRGTGLRGPPLQEGGFREASSVGKARGWSYIWDTSCVLHREDNMRNGAQKKLFRVLLHREHRAKEGPGNRKWGPERRRNDSWFRADGRAHREGRCAGVVLPGHPGVRWGAQPQLGAWGTTGTGGLALCRPRTPLHLHTLLSKFLGA